MSKENMRKRLASMSFSEKIKILEKLRDRSLAIAASGLRRKKKSSRQSVISRLDRYRTTECEWEFSHPDVDKAHRKSAIYLLR